MEKKFPIEGFPQKVQELISSLCHTLGFHVDYIAGALLVAFSTAIGKTHALEVKETWKETASIYLLLVGSPGFNKSAPLSFALKPLEDLTERVLLSKHGSDDYKLTPEYMFSTSSSAEITTQIVLSNTTPEAIFQVMSEDNTRQLLYADEAASIFRNFGRYSKGSDTEYFLSFFSGKTVIINRKTQPPIIIVGPILTLAGTIQPDVLRDVFKKGVDNGLQDRILMVNPDFVSRTGLSNSVLEPTVVPRYKAIINSLLEFEMRNGEPNLLRYSDEANNAVIEWSAINAELINAEENHRKQGLRSKIEIYLHRLALLNQLIYCVTEGEPTDKVGLRAVNASIAMVDYFYYMGEKTLMITGTDPFDSLNELQQKILNSLPEKFKTSEGVHRATVNGMPERTFKNLLKRRDLFKKEKMGYYSRLY